jgi:hypothetical protein
MDYSHEGCAWVEFEHLPEIVLLLPEEITEEWFRHGYFSPLDPILEISYTLGDCWWDIDPESGDGDVDGADLALCASGTIIDLGALASNFGKADCRD